MDRKTLISIIREELHEVIQERDMISSKRKEKERIVKSMKKNARYLKQKYGDRWKSVMHAVAMKQTMKEGEMTAAEVDDREDISNKLLKRKKEFQKKYGDDWEKVLYSTATKLAMGGE